MDTDEHRDDLVFFAPDPCSSVSICGYHFFFISSYIVEISRCEPARSIVQMVIEYLTRELALAISSGSIQTGCSGDGG
jgi:hypothetical protein